MERYYFFCVGSWKAITRAATQMAAYTEKSLCNIDCQKRRRIVSQSQTLDVIFYTKKIFSRALTDPL